MKTLEPKRVVSIADTLRALEVGDQCVFSALQETSIRCAISRQRKSGRSFSARRDGENLIVTRKK
ncbi:MAG: hypothetical protein K2O66_03735 [Bacteroidales bacterium]|nr:hypothetical protein [Bacteroidales bacterium]MDE7072462.1 hypothetical protein [Bacteroidales bacterium]